MECAYGKQNEQLKEMLMAEMSKEKPNTEMISHMVMNNIYNGECGNTQSKNGMANEMFELIKSGIEQYEK